MPKPKLVKMSERSDNALSWTGIDVMEDVLRKMRDGELPKVRKIIVMILDDSNGNFSVSHVKSMWSSEALAAMEVCKDNLVRQLREEEE